MNTIEQCARIVDQYRSDIIDGDYVSAGEVDLLTDVAKAIRALAPNLASARTAGDGSQNTTARMTQSVDVASESVAGRAPVRNASG